MSIFDNIDEQFKKIDQAILASRGEMYSTNTIKELLELSPTYSGQFAYVVGEMCLYINVQGKWMKVRDEYI